MKGRFSQSPRRIRNIVNSPFTFPILSKLNQGYRPSLIAEQLKTSPQSLNYHIQRLIGIGLIKKETADGVSWKLTEKGSFILKEKLRRSVNDPDGYPSLAVPTRLHNVSFAFKVKSFPENLRLRWKPLKNGVSKCHISNNDHKIELTKSEREGSSVMAIHMPEEYLFDPFKGIIEQYDRARGFATLAAQRLNLVISESGRLMKRPHEAFDPDLVTLLLTHFQTAEVPTKNGKAWIDSSNRKGELETNDPEYAYLYLLMPKAVNHIHQAIERMERYFYTYAMYYHPTLMKEN